MDHAASASVVQLTKVALFKDFSEFKEALDRYFSSIKWNI